MLRTAISILILASLWVSPATATQTPSGENSIERRYCTQYGPFVLRFDPDKAAGFFVILHNNDLGSIVGRLDGQHLKGKWIEVDNHGQIRISFTEDWSTFNAEYNVSNNPEHWSGDWIGLIAPDADTLSFDINDVTFYCH